MQFKWKARLKNYTVSYTDVLVLLPFLCVIQQNIFHTSAAQAIKGNRKIVAPSRAKVTTENHWIQESLNTHNVFRSFHGSPPLILNFTLCEISQYYANYLLQRNLNILDKQGRGKTYFEHNPEAGPAAIGENLYFSIMHAPIEPIPSPYAVLLWYEEIKDYDFFTAGRKPTSDPEAKIGHLTQLLWKSTSQMGTAYASRKLANNQVVTFVVANYFRQGNLILRGNEKKLYLENVLPPTISVEDINSAIVSNNVQSWWKEPESPFSTPKAWRDAALKAHNYYRNLHGSQPLRLNGDLCKVSQLWANHLLERGFRDFNLFRELHQIEANFKGVRLCKFGDSSIYFITEEENISAEHVLKSWYKQSKNYDFSRHQKLSDLNGNIKTDDFERIVWNSTTEFCMSYARKQTDNGEYLTYVTANYYPSLTDRPDDNRAQNVFRSKDSKKDASSVGTTILIAFISVLAFIVISSVGTMLFLFKFKHSLYESVMKAVKLKK